MLEVQLCRRSPQGAVIPIGRTTNRAVAEYVADAIRRELAGLRFDDPLLNDVAAIEREKLATHLYRDATHA